MYLLPTATNSSLVFDFDCFYDVVSQYLLHPFIMITLCLLSVFVVLGNLLVVSAIWHENQLHSVTNYLIASLAAADCLVGAVVMPFSIISEIMVGSWTFGPIWCDLWHSFDVLASTASIMNLCAISLDRYLAITNPISYPRRMTPRRVALLIAFLWTCSSLISFPAIIWWRAVGNGPLQQFVPESSSSSSSATKISTKSQFNETSLAELVEVTTQYKCVFTDDTYYLLFSSFISFYGPLCVMLYAYYKIYRAAVQQTRFLKHGSKQVMIGRRSNRSRYKSDRSVQSAGKRNSTSDYATSKAGLPSWPSSDQDRHLVLRAHRGGGAGLRASAYGCKSGDATTNKTADHPRRRELQRFGGSVMSKVSSQLEPGEMRKKRRTLDGEKLHTGDDNLGDQTNTRSPARFHDNHNKDRFDKRDIMRLHSQRFDINPINETISTASKKTKATDTLGFDHDCAKANKIETKLNSIENHPANESMKCPQGPPTGKPLLAFINSRSANVDVSIVDQRLSSSAGCGDKTTNATTTTTCYRPSMTASLQNNSSTSPQHQRLDPSDSTAKSHSDDSNNNNDEKVAASLVRCIDNDDISDEIINSGYPDSSSNSDSGGIGSGNSSSSGSYGTGSVVSVMVRPAPERAELASPMATKRMLDYGSDTSINTNQTENDGRGVPVGASISIKMRRALSFGSTMMQQSRHEVPKLQMDQSHVDPTSELKQRQPPQRSTVSFNKKHRASCGYPYRVDIFNGFKSPRTLNIRSWVKLARSRANKSAAVGGQLPMATGQTGSTVAAKLKKPPASLLPLMMMNSDTSTDSSVVTCAMKQGSSTNKWTRMNRSATMEASASLMDPRSRDTDRSGGARATTKKARRHVSSCSLVSLRLKDMSTDGQVIDKSLRFSEDLESGSLKPGECRQGQVLYYNSDKLIQSIVDLTAIQYIDCATTTTETADQPSLVRRVDGTELEGEKSSPIEGATTTQNEKTLPTDNGAAGEKMSFDPAEQTLMDAGDRLVIGGGDGSSNLLPTSRQHRSVGKKLTKLAKERKAAKTLGIVVGVFILCWLPFFVVNIVVALCGTECVYKPQIFVSIVTWLGWLNSAMNPVIYACWSRDFRRAFRRVLCTWVEFVCPYDGAIVAKKLKLKKGSNYSPHETYLNRTMSSLKGNTSSATIRSGVFACGVGQSTTAAAAAIMNGDVSQSLLSDQAH